MKLPLRLLLTLLLLHGQLIVRAVDAAQKPAWSATYHAEVMSAIERARSEVRQKKSVSEGDGHKPGSVTLAFTITPTGEVFMVEASEGAGAWQPVREVWTAAIYAAKFPKPPKELLAKSPNGASFRLKFEDNKPILAKDIVQPAAGGTGKANAKGSNPLLEDYQARVKGEVEQVWRLKFREYQDLAVPGKFELKFIVTPAGKLAKLEMPFAEGADLFRAMLIPAIQKREYPKPPEEVLQEFPEGPPIEIVFVIKP
jgi:hypothetical protein